MKYTRDKTRAEILALMTAEELAILLTIAPDFKLPPRSPNGAERMKHAQAIIRDTLAETTRGYKDERIKDHGRTNNETGANRPIQSATADA